ncbi:MAG: 50S ribosomal protein L21e [Candidatus Aenigmarchaeota archaeon]|nr:50S ribosomal protein L21e [Candidatus Aenigmarchaeota archaeon]
MVTRSHGVRWGTKKKLRKHSKTPITRYLQAFEEGDTVVILPDSASPQGMPFPRFKGMAGKVKGRRGDAYVVSVMDGNKMKTLAVKPQHIKRLEK